MVLAGLEQDAFQQDSSEPSEDTASSEEESSEEESSEADEQMTPQPIQAEVHPGKAPQIENHKGRYTHMIVRSLCCT